MSSKDRQAKFRQRMNELGHKLYSFYLNRQLARQLDRMIMNKIAETGSRKNKATALVIESLINNVADAVDAQVETLIFDPQRSKAIADSLKADGKSASKIAKALTELGLGNRRLDPYTKDQVNYLLKQKNLL